MSGLVIPDNSESLTEVNLLCEAGSCLVTFQLHGIQEAGQEKSPQLHKLGSVLCK